MGAPQEIFSQGDSLMHRLDPRAKVFGAMLFALVQAVAKTPQAAFTGLVVGFVLLLLARLPLRPLLLRLLLVNGFTAFIWVMLPLTYGGSPLFSIGSLAFSEPGLQLAALITLKTNGIFCAMLALLGTSPVPALGQAMRWWKVPEKLCWILLFSYRYLFVIHGEYQRLRRAAAMRCFQPRTSMGTYGTYGNLVGMTLVRSYNRSSRVSQAMALRCFQGRFHSLDTPAAGPSDLAMGAVLFICALFLLVLDYYFLGA